MFTSLCNDNFLQEVGGLMIALWKTVSWVYQWKNFENRSVWQKYDK